MEHPLHLSKLPPQREQLRAVTAALNRRYRALALKHHPDKAGDPEVFKVIQPALQQEERFYDFEGEPPPWAKEQLAQIAKYRREVEEATTKLHEAMAEAESATERGRAKATAVAARNAARGELAAAQRVRKADREAHAAEKTSWRARTEAEMETLDGKVRRLLRTRDAEIAGLREALSSARGERDRARGYLEELGNELPAGRPAVEAGDCY